MYFFCVDRFLYTVLFGYEGHIYTFFMGPVQQYTFNKGRINLNTLLGM